MLLRSKFNPATECTRRPTPELFDHLRKWIPSDQKYIDITSIQNLQDINLQLEQTPTLYASNIIQRVIAQLIGAYGLEFRTIKATDGGALYVAPMGSGHIVLNKVINFSTAATHSVVAAVTGKKIKITNILLIVAGETNITLLSAATPISGPMDLGGTAEPRGFCSHFGDTPLETAEGEAFQITSSGAVQVSGCLTYFTE